MFIKLKLTDMVHEILKTKIKEGDIVVDATVGNGYDTVFLAKVVGKTGRVIGFDIQEKALNNTKDKLIRENLEGRVILIHDSHSNIDKYIKEPINGAMFNLGYLPQGDEKIITKAETSLEALRKTSSLLLPGGFITIISYWGHEGGIEEKESVEEFLSNLDTKKFITAKYNYLNREGYPPIVYFLQRM